MAIVYYPNNLNKKIGSAIDRVMAKRDLKTVRGAADISATGLDVVISANGDWQINNIMLTFSGATARNYGWEIMNGRKVVTGANDVLWFQTNTTLWTKVTLSAGFYNGTDLATELQTQLDTTFAPITFTVAYDDTTGFFTITPSSGLLKYFAFNQVAILPNKQSTGGQLFGLTANTTMGGTVVSDAAVFGLNESAALVSETASTVTEHYNDDIHILGIDQALRITSGTAAITVNYTVSYEEMV